MTGRTRRFRVWNLSARELRGPMAKLDYLNPQTSQVSIDSSGNVQD